MCTMEQHRKDVHLLQRNCFQALLARLWENLTEAASLLISHIPCNAAQWE